MKKAIIALALAALAIGSFSRCTVEPMPMDLQPAYQYTDDYYAALRAFKESDHAISYIFFGDYGTPYSPAFRFMGIPDSVDVVNLWGGFPKPGTLDHLEMNQMRKLKGTKVVACKIIRLAPSNTNYFAQSWAKQAKIPVFMDAYDATYGVQYDANYETVYETTYARLISEGKSELGLALADQAGVRGLVHGLVVGVILDAVSGVVRVHEDRNLRLLRPGLREIVRVARRQADDLAGHHLGALELPHLVHLQMVQGAGLGEAAPEVHHVHAVGNAHEAEGGRVRRAVVAEEDIGDGMVALLEGTEGRIVVIRVLIGRLQVHGHRFHRTAGERADGKRRKGQGYDCFFHIFNALRIECSCPTTAGCRRCRRPRSRTPRAAGRHRPSRWRCWPGIPPADTGGGAPAGWC